MDLTDNVIEEVQEKEGLIASFLDTLPEKALNLGIRIGLALVFFFIGMQLIRLIRKIIRKSMNRAGAETNAPFAQNPSGGRPERVPPPKRLLRSWAHLRQRALSRKSFR